MSGFTLGDIVNYGKEQPGVKDQTGVFETRKELVDTICREIKKKELTQKQIGALVGVSQSTVASIKRKHYAEWLEKKSHDRKS